MLYLVPFIILLIASSMESLRFKRYRASGPSGMQKVTVVICTTAFKWIVHS